MGRKPKYSAEVKINAVKEYLDEKNSIATIAKHLSVDHKSIRQWINNYEAMGEDAFFNTRNKHYSKDEKVQAVLAYMTGEGTLMNICKKFKIYSTCQLMDWIKKYSHEEFKSSGKGGTITMTKGRKTTFDERVEIASYCISHDHNYIEASEKFSVSYQQARSYTIKYETGGIDALQDNHVAVGLTAEAVVSLIQFHTGVPVVVERTDRHTVTVDFDTVAFSGLTCRDRIPDSFKYVHTCKTSFLRCTPTFAQQKRHPILIGYLAVIIYSIFSLINWKLSFPSL